MSKKRYIDKDALIAELDERGEITHRAAKLIETFPESDVCELQTFEQQMQGFAKVVRCRDCECWTEAVDYSRRGKFGICELEVIIRPADFFCAYGEEVTNGD